MKLKTNTKILIITAIILIIAIILILLIRNKTLASDISLTSPIYTIEDNYIINISPNTSIELYQKYFDLENCSLKVVTPNNQIVASGNIYTGSKTIVYDNYNNIINTYTNIVTGDITDDGFVNNEDITTLAKYLMGEENLEESKQKAIDIIKDNQIKINDLTKLQDTINSSYTNISLNKEELNMMTGETERLIATITPNQILNQNATWTSSNNDIVTVDESGKILAKEEGEAQITATTSDGKLQKTVKVTVDNTIRLISTTNQGYVGGDEVKVTIKSVDYENLNCISSDEEIASCTINNNILTVKALKKGFVTIDVTSPKYKKATYEFTSIIPDFNVMYKQYCMKTGTQEAGVITGYDFGEVEIINVTDKEIITEAITNNKNFYIKSGTKTGDAQIIFKENNGYQLQTVTANVYSLSISPLGVITKVSNGNYTSQITSENTGALSCKSQDESIATCQILDNTLITTPISTGQTTIKITGSKCGILNYPVIIQNEVIE